jgi:hypothetical protein
MYAIIPLIEYIGGLGHFQHFLVLPQTKDTTSDKRKTHNEMPSKNLEVKHVSEKPSLKRVPKTTSRNLQEFFKKF